MARGLLTVRLRYGKARPTLQANLQSSINSKGNEAHRW